MAFESMPALGSMLGSSQRVHGCTDSTSLPSSLPRFTDLDCSTLWVRAATRGDGIAYVGGIPVGKTRLSAVSIGFQVGAQRFIEVIFFRDQTAWNDFTRENFEFGAQVSAVAFSSGVSADLAYNGGVAVVTMAKGGLMYEASVGGQKFEYEAYD